MDGTRSPFLIGTLVSGDSFVDREWPRKKLRANFRSGQNTVLISPRRWGKSSLIRQVALDMAREKNVRFAFLDLFHVRAPYSTVTSCVCTPSQSPPTSASVDLTALAQNVAHVRRLAPHADVLAVVKANAYGHGATEITRALQQLAIRRFGVATVEEGIALRQAGIQDVIVVMGPTMPAQFPDLVSHRLTPVLCRADLIPAFAAKVQAGTAPYPVHIKVETGMGRLGVSLQELPDLMNRPELSTPLRLEGLMTHLADADNQYAGQTEEQLRQFQQALHHLQGR